MTKLNDADLSEEKKEKIRKLNNSIGGSHSELLRKLLLAVVENKETDFRDNLEDIGSGQFLFSFGKVEIRRSNIPNRNLFQKRTSSNSIRTSWNFVARGVNKSENLVQSCPQSPTTFCLMHFFQTTKAQTTKE